MKKLLVVLCYAVAIVGSIYIGGYLLAIKPIADMCEAYDSQTLTATLVGMSVVNFF